MAPAVDCGGPVPRRRTACRHRGANPRMWKRPKLPAFRGTA